MCVLRTDALIFRVYLTNYVQVNLSGPDPNAELGTGTRLLTYTSSRDAAYPDARINSTLQDCFFNIQLSLGYENKN